MSKSDKPSSQETHQESDELPSLTFLEMLGSVLSAAFGVQSQRNRERDFQQGSVMRFVAVGVGLTAAFVLSLLFLVKALVN